MNKFVFVALMMTLMVFSVPALANTTDIAPLCVGCPPKPPTCIECTADATHNHYEIYAPPGLNSLEHKYFYLWQLPDLGGDKITAAGITFYDIDDWRPEYNDKLYIDLLNSQTLSVAESHMTKIDNGDGTNGVVYRGQDGCLDGDHDDDLKRYGDVDRIGVYQDNKCGPETVSFCFSEALLQSLNDSIQNGDIVGIGLDPDCWYIHIPNTEADWIKFWYCTEKPPNIPVRVPLSWAVSA